MASVAVTLDDNAKRIFAAAFAGNTRVRTAFRNGLKIIQRYAMDHNNLKQSEQRYIDTRILTEAPDLSGEVFVPTDKKSIIYRYFGTGLYGPKRAKYPIVPVTQKWLRWNKSDRFHFAKKVMHPGIKGDAFLDKALAAKGADANKIVRDAIFSEFGISL